MGQSISLGESSSFLQKGIKIPVPVVSKVFLVEKKLSEKLPTQVYL